MTSTSDGLLASDALIAWRVEIDQLVDKWRSTHVDLSDNALKPVPDLVGSR